ncbi:hypothetical protein AHFPHNDE_01670 [Pseudomonas sp. MM227]|uniref:Uncharacterized protein n=1 Tax=Pseudomonas baltica TaxID=2762576 RepID=A0A7X1G3F1_9PSED|nr:MULTISPECIES: hypothetical protein [Pseudomonas]MBC2677688.1 hypothetical protein [Pseudomonas baltica]CAI3787997.1 hypothetical protein AHFPHNDE_01670 [Pseudomonas sp. MM227]
MVFDLQQAKQFITTTGLPAKPEMFSVTAGMGVPALETAKAQSLVVGSNIMSFKTGVDAGARQALTDSSLFAQLAAAKSIGNDPNPLAFFDAYFGTLVKIGWLIRQKETAELSYTADALDVHEAMIGVITSFLSPITGAAVAVLAVLKGLQKMSADTPFITLFNSQRHHESVSRFQFTYVYADEEQGLMARAMAFVLETDTQLTQILFFKLQSGEMSLRRSEGVLSIDGNALKALQPPLAAKMNAYREKYIAGVELDAV